MPVLDAKALDIDPKGMAFLKSVLRQKYTPRSPLKLVPKGRVGRVNFHFRLIRRSRELLSDTV